MRQTTEPTPEPANGPETETPKDPPAEQQPDAQDQPVNEQVPENEQVPTDEKVPVNEQVNDFVEGALEETTDFARLALDYVQETSSYIQLGLVAVALLIGLGLSKWLESRFEEVDTEKSQAPSTMRRFLRKAAQLAAPGFTLLLLFPAIRVAQIITDNTATIETASRLVTVWLLFTAVRSLISSPMVRTIGTWIIVPAALLHIFNELGAVIDMLESAAFDFGEFELTAYTLVKALVFFTIVFWIARFLSQMGSEYIRGKNSLTLSTKELLIKLFDIALYILMFVFTLDLIGIDLTALAVFSGALGVGLGFGLQKIASNFISGIILLSEKSVTLGNLVEMDNGIYGYLRKLGARASIIETLDGKEVMVPNEDFITSRVSNLTHSSNMGRVDVSVGVAYDTDLHKAHDVILEAAKGYEKASKDEKYQPECWLRNFGDSSVDFLLIFWLDNVQDGKWRAQSEVMFRVWDALKENDIEIPFPQRDLHLRSVTNELPQIPERTKADDKPEQKTDPKQDTDTESASKGNTPEDASEDADSAGDSKGEEAA